MRFLTRSTFEEITKDKPEKRLLQPLKKKGGRNCYGRITMRFRGGGHKQMYRVIDFKRDKKDIAATVIAIEYDPNRSSRIALLEYTDKERRYIIAPLELKVGEQVISSDNPQTDIKPGNTLLIKNIPTGTLVHNIELVKGQGGKIARGAGASAQVMAKEGSYAHVRLPSGEVRLISVECAVTIGQIGNVDHETIVIGKAGRNNWLGKKPNIRGLAMNPVDHPHGGGEGKSGQGNPHPVTPWGKPTKGFRTRKKVKYSDGYIIKRRK